jgi:hypothetical protein
MLAALAVLAAGAAPPPAPLVRQHAQLDRACHLTVASVQTVLAHAATTQVQAIVIHFTVATRGTLTGLIAFNPAGTSISLAGDRPPPRPSQFGCGEASGSSHGIGSGHSQVVSRVRRTFTKLGRYAVTFTLSRAGQRILARLGAAERTYRKHHPHGDLPPTIAYGIMLSYRSAG